MPVLERMLDHWKTSGAGVALGAVFYYLMTSWHCQLPADSFDWVKWATVAGPAILGILSKDK